MWCLRYETGEMTGRDHYHCLLSVLGSEWVTLQTCFYLMDFWEKKLRCGHARVRVFAPALGGVAYTCKDLADSLAGKDRYEFETFFAPRTVLTLSDSSPREVCGAVETIRFPLHRHAATDSRLRRRHPRHPWTRTSSGLWKVKGPGGPPRQRGAAGLLEGFLCQNWTDHGARRTAPSIGQQA